MEKRFSECPCKGSDYFPVLRTDCNNVSSDQSYETFYARKLRLFVI